MNLLHYAPLGALLFVAPGCGHETKKDMSATPVVATDKGLVSGLRNTDGTVRIFKGIPYAAPPVGDLRWRAPRPHAAWTDTLSCTSFPASAMQERPAPLRMWTEEFMAQPEPLSEDCLYLNIWAPDSSTTGKLPVLVWIHGGAFMSGAADCAIYDGEGVAKEGIVYVSINYRLGIFGFMAHPDLSKESPDSASGNYGLMDQVAALQWVHNNIAAFGGDPDKVTIDGQSAGSMAIQSLVASPLAKGLFRGAIAESGELTGRPARNLADAEKIGLDISSRAKAADIAALRTLPADSVLSLGRGEPFGRFAPIVDGYVIPEDPRKIFREKKQNDVNVLAGWVTGDADLVLRQVLPAHEFRKMVAPMYGNHMDAFDKIFPTSTPQASDASQHKFSLMSFTAFPCHEWALSNTHPVYVYQWDYVPTDKPDFPNYGAFHTSEVPYALHSLSHWNRPWKSIDYKVQDIMSSYWANFVKTGNPNGPDLAEWKPYDAEAEMIMILNDHPVPKPGLYASEFAVMEQGVQ